MRRKYVHFCALLAGTLATAGCTSADCQSNAIIVSPVLSVTNAITGAPICNATVAQEGDASVVGVVPVTEIEAGSGCELEIGVPAGMTRVVVSLVGYGSATLTVNATTTACGQPSPTPPVINVRLIPD